MTKYHIYDEEKNHLLWYGCHPDDGYFYEILEVTELAEGKGNIIEKKSSLRDFLTSPEFYSILDEWEAPREHLLAVSLFLDF
jgi:hypothetical protein